MYFDGHADGNKGRCPASGGGHEGHGDDPATFNFVLPFNVPPTANAQNNWRNCWKCQAMYFDGYPDKGRCAAGGGHEGHGDDPRTFNFVLPHPITPSLRIEERFLPNGGTQIVAFGRGFTPDHRVNFDYQYRSASNPNTLTQGPAMFGQANDDGSLETAINKEDGSDLPRNAFQIAVKATDTLTGTSVGSNTIRPQV